jgi:hypothetical protein
MGVAIVIVNHLRIVATQLHEILPRYTEMPVELITDGVIPSVLGARFPAKAAVHRPATCVIIMLAASGFARFGGR